jgi:hypothetical protein
MFTTNQQATLRDGRYMLETTMYWTSGTTSTMAEVIVTPHKGRDDLEMDAAGWEQLAADYLAVAAKLRAADMEAGLS